MNIYEITIRTNPDGKTEVRKCLDPLFDAKLLLEGVGVLISEISKWSKTNPPELKERVWGMEKSDVLKLLHDYLDLVGRDYKETGEVFQLPRLN